MNDQPTIHGQNHVSLASILEYIQQPDHPLYKHVKRQADEFVAAETAARVERARQAMRDQMKHIDEVEWSQIVD